MKLYRNNPGFDTKGARKSVAIGCLVALLSFGLILYFITTLVQIGIKKMGLGFTLLGLVFIPVMVLQGIMAINMAVEGASKLILQHRWIRNAAKTHARVVEKEEDSYVANYDGDTLDEYSLALDLEPLITADDLTERLVWAGVSKRVYNRYSVGDQVCIYYPSTNPFNFIIEGE
jgi:hypothetical protein